MKKLIYLVLTVLLVFACVTQQEAAKKTAENSNKTVPYKKSVMLLGKANRAGFQKAPFSTWFNSKYEKFNPDSETIEALKKHIKGVTIVAYMGTWCGDSKRETPHFYKILDAINFKEKNLELHAVDRSKKTPEHTEQNLNIIRVPTFIFYKKGKEIGRYVERPRESLEKDMLKILSGQPYKHAYDK
jgi:thiol-disulfide isomerase/thioredoxin